MSEEPITKKIDVISNRIPCNHLLYVPSYNNFDVIIPSFVVFIRMFTWYVFCLSYMIRIMALRFESIGTLIWRIYCTSIKSSA